MVFRIIEAQFINLFLFVIKFESFLKWSFEKLLYEIIHEKLPLKIGENLPKNHRRKKHQQNPKDFKIKRSKLDLLFTVQLANRLF